MTKKEYAKVFDEVKMDNITNVLNDKFYTITDASCIYRRQEGLDTYSPWPIHVYDVEIEDIAYEDVM